MTGCLCNARKAGGGGHHGKFLLPNVFPPCMHVSNSKGYLNKQFLKVKPSQYVIHTITVAPPSAILNISCLVSREAGWFKDAIICHYPLKVTDKLHRSSSPLNSASGKTLLLLYSSGVRDSWTTLVSTVYLSYDLAELSCPAPRVSVWVCSSMVAAFQAELNTRVTYHN